MPAPRLSELLFLLVLTDVLFVVLHLFHALDVAPAHFGDRQFSLQQARGFSEVFQYVKEFWISAAFLLLSLRRGERAHLVLAALFAYLLIDDSFEVHESLGQAVAARLDLVAAFGLRASDFGELAVQGVVGCVVGALLLLGYRWGSATFRHTVVRVVGLLAALAFFGVLVDLVHSAVASSRYAYGIFTLLEEGGELVSMSALAWYACTVLASVRARPASDEPGRADPTADAGIAPVPAAANDRVSMSLPSSA